MNEERIKRFEEARKYQKMAMKALLPDYMEKHIDVIEQEMKAMIFEVILETAKSVKEKKVSEYDSMEETKSDVKVKKVTID